MGMQKSGTLKTARDVPEKVKEIARSIEKDQGESAEVAYRIAWEQYCSYINPDYEGCTEKGKSKRKSPKSEYTTANLDQLKERISNIRSIIKKK